MLITLIILRLTATIIFSGGAIWLASQGKEGWGWCIFAALKLKNLSLPPLIENE